MMKVKAFIENGPVSIISSVQNVIRMTLMLIGIWGLVAFAVPAQAAHCHEEPQATQAETSHAEISHAMDQHHAMSADHDCCSPDCHCPSALCGAGHGVPLVTAYTFPIIGATEQIQCAADLYSLLPVYLLIKPPMAA